MSGALGRVRKRSPLFIFGTCVATGSCSILAPLEVSLIPDSEIAWPVILMTVATPHPTFQMDSHLSLLSASPFPTGGYKNYSQGFELFCVIKYLLPLQKYYQASDPESSHLFGCL